jgi:hypothetical protein
MYTFNQPGCTTGCTTRLYNVNVRTACCTTGCTNGCTTRLYSVNGTLQAADGTYTLFRQPQSSPDARVNWWVSHSHNGFSHERMQRELHISQHRDLWKLPSTVTREYSRAFLYIVSARYTARETEPNGSPYALP